MLNYRPGGNSHISENSMQNAVLDPVGCDCPVRTKFGGGKPKTTSIKVCDIIANREESLKLKAAKIKCHTKGNTQDAPGAGNGIFNGGKY